VAACLEAGQVDAACGAAAGAARWPGHLQQLQLHSCPQGGPRPTGAPAAGIEQGASGLVRFALPDNAEGPKDEKSTYDVKNTDSMCTRQPNCSQLYVS
jgi:hypothetical protein